MAKIWKYGMIIILLYGLMKNHQTDMMNALYDTPYIVLELLTSIVLSACLWGGFLHIMQETGFIYYFTPIVKPLLSFMYGKVINNHTIFQLLSTNMIANLLGLSSLATLSGIKAIQALDAHPIKPTRAQLMLVITNGAGISLFPSSIIMLRQQFHSTSLYAFYPYMLIISIIVFFIGILIVRCKHE